MAAHPRSRGENCPSIRSRRLALGSSPLTRGKHPTLNHIVINRGLIPAHAGKTDAHPEPRPAEAAHPRSRGENIDGFVSGIKSAGSSPLTRGKLGVPPARILPNGLIPAHAGKTTCTAGASARLTAHPRSRGENERSEVSHTGPQGSSPLTRGKPLASLSGCEIERLIPAHAGKTGVTLDAWRHVQAHPRSRGENT